jgi:PKD repeat protein
MKKLLLFCSMLTLACFAQAQTCSPDLSITEPGIYPDTIANLPHAYGGAPYSTIIQLKVITDTSSGSTPVTVVDITVDSVSGMPATFSYNCNPSNCVFPGGSNACITLNGSPTLAMVGTHPIVVHATLHGLAYGFIPVSQSSTVNGYKIVVLGLPVSQFSGTPTVICSGESVTYTDLSSNEPTAWAWSFPGGTPSSSSLQSPPPVTYSSSGTKNVTLIAYSPAGNNTNTKTAYITVNSTPSATVTPNGSVTICSGSNVLLSANTGTGLTYQWLQHNVNISGATGSTYTTSTAGSYKVRVTNSTGCSKTSAATTISVTTVPATITPGGATTFCNGGSVTLNANSGTGLTYKWQRNGVIIGGATSISYLATLNGTYKVQVTGTGGCSTLSAALKVTVNGLPAATVSANGPLTFCAGQSVTLTANSGAGLTYQWKKNNSNIGGATGVSYVATTTGAYKVVVTNSSSCTKASKVKNVLVNCREENENTLTSENTDATLYPNPATDKITLDLELTHAGSVSIKIYDITGKFIDEIAAGNFAEGKRQFFYNTSTLSNGVYFTVIKTSDKVKTIKLIVNNN